jgi:hypothetical protein
MKISNNDKLAVALAKMTAPKDNSKQLRNISNILDMLRNNGFNITLELSTFTADTLYGASDPSQKREIEIMKKFLASVKYLPN